MNTAIHNQIEQLLVYSSNHLMLDDLDIVYARNNILTSLGLADYEQYEVDENKIDKLDSIDSLIAPIVDWAAANGATKVKDKKAFAAALIYFVAKPPSVLASIYLENAKKNAAKAKDWLVDYLAKSNYAAFGALVSAVPEIAELKLKAPAAAAALVEHSVPQIEDLIAFARAHLLLDERDVAYTRARLVAIFGLSSHVEYTPDFDIIDEHSVPDVLLEGATTLAKELKLIKEGEEAIFADLLMGTLSLKPSSIFDIFEALRKKNPQKAFDWLYEYAIKSNYVHYSAIAQNPHWEAKSTRGKLEVTINMARKEKAAPDTQKKSKGGQYPACDICSENEGIIGKKTLRTIPMRLHGEDWFWQFSPYSYFNQHGVIINSAHVPMVINNDTYRKMLDFNEYIPQYFVGVNAALEGVGGSILCHDHFQGGRGNMPAFRAPILKSLRSEEHPYMKIDVLDWYLPTIRLTYTNKKHLADFASSVQSAWENYSDKDIGLVAKTGSVQHSAVAAASRKIQDGQFSIDLFLRNNAKSDEFPNGIFAAKGSDRAIKAESVGIIESLGHFILPSRLTEQLKKIEKFLTKESRYNEEKLIGTDLEIFMPIIERLLKESTGRISPFEATLNIKYEVNRIVEQIITECAPFKPTDDGREGLWKFLGSLGIK